MSYEKGIEMKKKLRREAGGAAAEFAIILPLLAMILFGMVEFGLLLYNKQILTNASREGARAGIVVEVPKKTEADIAGIIKNYCNRPDPITGIENKLLVNFNGASNRIDDSNITIVNAQGSFPTELSVEVKYTYNFLVLSILDRLFPPGSPIKPFGPLELKAITIMRHE